MKKLYKKILIDWSAYWTVLFVILAGIGGYVSKDIELKLSLTDLLPQDHPSVQKFNKLTDIVGGVGYFEILLHAEDKESHLKIAPEIVNAMKASPLVRSAFFHREEHFFLTRALYYAEIPKLKELDEKVATEIKTAKRSFFDIGLWDDEEKAKDAAPKKDIDPEFKKFADRMTRLSEHLISEDRKDLLIMVKPSFDSLDMKKSKELVKFGEETLKKMMPANVNYHISGRYFSKVKDTEVMEQDIYILGILSNVVMGLVLLFYFRSVRAVISIFIPVVLGLGITSLVCWYFIGHVNLITGFLVGMLAGVGSDYGIHLLWRIRLELKEPSSDDPDPLWRTLETCGWANIVTLVSTAAVLFFMCGSSLKVFSEFGFICGVGLSAILVTKMCTFYFTSKLLKLETVMKRDKYPFQKYELPILKSNFSYYGSLAVILVLAVFSVKAGFEFDFDKMLEHSEEVRRTSHLIDVIYDRSTTPSAFAANTKEEAIAIEKLIKDKYMPNIVRSVVSGGSIVPDGQAEKEVIVQSVAKRIEKLSDRALKSSLDVPVSTIRTWVGAKPFVWEDLPTYVQEALRGTQQAGYLLYVYPTKALNTGPAVAEIAGMIKDVESHFPNIVSGSDAGIFSEILKLIERDGLILITLIIVFVGIFLWAILRDFKHMVLTYVSFLVSLPTGIGLMALFGVKFNIFNVALMPVFIAVGVEIPIQLMQRSGEIHSGFKAVRDIAVSLQLSLLTTAVGFGVLVFTRAGILRSMGWMSILIVGAGWYIGLFVHPALLERYYRWEERRKVKKDALAASK